VTASGSADHEMDGATLRCDICESPLVQSTRPDDRTQLLWRRHICRACGDRLNIALRKPSDNERSHT